MPNSTPARTSWKRVHLSTALVWLVVCGAFLGLNLMQRGPYVVTEDLKEHSISLAHPRKTWSYEYELGWFRGFPFAIMLTGETYREKGPQDIDDSQFVSQYPYAYRMKRYTFLCAAANFLLPLLVAFMSGRLVESVWCAGCGNNAGDENGRNIRDKKGSL